MDDSDKKFRNILAFLLSIPVTLWGLHVSSCLWGWFMIPAGLPALGWAQLFGLWLAVWPGYMVTEEPDKEVFQKEAIRAITWLLRLGVGWVIWKATT